MGVLTPDGDQPLLDKTLQSHPGDIFRKLESRADQRTGEQDPFEYEFKHRRAKFWKAAYRTPPGIHLPSPASRSHGR